MTRKAAKLLVRLLIINTLVTFVATASLGQQRDSIAFKKDLEKLLRKHGLNSESYMITVSSENQSGGQTAFIINNNYYSDSLFNKTNFIFSIDTTGGRSILLVAPKRGMWAAPFVMADTSLKNFYDPGPGMSTGLQLGLQAADGSPLILHGRASSYPASSRTPLKIYLTGRLGEFYFFGDFHDRDKTYVFENGSVRQIRIPFGPEENEK